MIRLTGLVLAAIPTVIKLSTLSTRRRDGSAIRTAQASGGVGIVIFITRTRG